MFESIMDDIYMTKYVCIGCGSEFNENVKIESCPYCGEWLRGVKENKKESDSK